MIPLLSRWWRGHVNSLINCCCILQIVEILMGRGDEVVEGEGSPNSVCQLLCDEERASGSRNASKDACGQLLLHSRPRGGS